MSVKPRDDILAHHMPHLIVVGTDEGSIFLRVSLALEHNDGNTLVVGTVDGCRDCGNLIGSYNKQVNAFI